MSQVAMAINGRIYRLTCGQGEEERLLQLGADVATRVDEFSQSFGQVGENRLLLLAALRLADELLDARTLLEKHGDAPLKNLKRKKKSRASTDSKPADDPPLDAEITTPTDEHDLKTTPISSAR